MVVVRKLAVVYPYAQNTPYVVYCSVMSCHESETANPSIARMDGGADLTDGSARPPKIQVLESTALPDDTVPLCVCMCIGR